MGNRTTRMSIPKEYWLPRKYSLHSQKVTLRNVDQDPIESLQLFLDDDGPHGFKSVRVSRYIVPGPGISESAHATWEITQVNEMLTQMERHPYPFACTTNAPELLDAAAARRFLFKVHFLPMTADQIARAYRRAFGAEAPAFVLKVSALTPADFATVARKASALDERDPRTLARWLEYEAQAKPDAGRRKIGF
jgi:hypothetical protein